MLVIPLAGGTPIIVDRGGELIRSLVVGIAELTVPSGIPEVITPQWSADGQWFAFLKRVGGRTQVWAAAADGSGSHPITDSDSDVVHFYLVKGGDAVAFSTLPQIRTIEREHVLEGQEGYHFDDRFIPIAASSPQLPTPLAETWIEVDLRTGDKSAIPAPSNSGAADRMYGPKDSDFRPQPDGRAAAWVAAVGANFAPSQTTVKYIAESGTVSTCAHQLCSQARAPAWLASSGSDVIYLRREGWAKSSTGVYRWKPGTARPRRVLQTDDYIVDCQPIRESLLCLSESAVQPRRLVLFDLKTGRRAAVFDPNPEWRHFTIGAVRRLNVRNDAGLDSTADFVYPNGYRKGHAYPTVVVQYVSRGLLRGGVGDEYPILALAAQGYAVLSVNRPPHLGLLAGGSNMVETERTNLQDWANRKSILSSIETPLRQLIAEGVVDPKRIGITGLSDGSTTVQFALVHSSMFAAAIMSGCCWERDQGALLGPQIARIFSQVGYPNLLQPAPEFWSQISLVDNAKRISVPILIQAADSEYLSALAAYTALRQAGRPADMFVFPDEHHNKWQPSHRLAIYRRTIKWFDFWLKDQEAAQNKPDPEITHWRALKRQSATAVVAVPSRP
ncbi:dipeptidyl aminopeptidase/acylaminoacyl peptidase [Sphingobium sp. B2D3A]|nr:dipeptidyl aminopeptidase/acylaminoacyl peptidase [Sphingobium sp. B2D3A]